MRVWITKYALTQGILEGEASPDNPSGSGCIVQFEAGHRSYVSKKYWHETEDDAVRHARLMAERKMRSLQNQMNKTKEIWSELNKRAVDLREKRRKANK